MVNRERTLMILVGGVAVVLVGYFGSLKYVAAKKALDGKYAQKVKERDSVNFENELKYRNADRWHSYQAQTLSMDPSNASALLRDDLNKLADSCGLERTSVNIDSTLAPLGRPARGQTEVVRALGAGMHTEGTTEQVARFMYRLHSRPYLMRIKNLSITMPLKAAPGTLAVQTRLEAILLPNAKLVRGYKPANLEVAEAQETKRTPMAFDEYRKIIRKRKPFQASQQIVLKAGMPNPANGQPLPVPEVTTVDLRWSPEPAKDASYVIGYKVHFAKGSPGSMELLAELSKSQANVRRDGLEVGPTYYWRVDTEYEDWEGEAVTTKGDLWSFTVKKKPDPPRPPDSRPSDDGSHLPPPIPPRPADADFTLASVLSSPRGGQYVILQDRRQPNNPNPPEQKVELGQPLYGGTLIYLEPRGAVSEIELKPQGVASETEPEPQGAASEKKHEWRFHPLGQQLAEGVTPLDDKNALYGDIYTELLKLLEKSQGITQAPGGSPTTGGQPGLENIDP